MLLLNQKALLFIQLVNIWSVSTADHSDVSVSRGDPVVLTCYMSNENTTMTQWTKDGWYFMHSSSSNRTFSNFSSDRLRIDTNKPSTLSIDNTQHDDAGLYSCLITGKQGLDSTSWTVTVLENQNANGSSQGIIFALLFVIGLILCFMTTAICLYRRNVSGHQNQDSRTFTWVQYNILDGPLEAVPSSFQVTAVWRRTGKQDVEAELMTRGTTKTSGND
ncbi:uncharacterized protein LOC129361350 isoform X2 [Poeciliopsis prolifica]|uniref:uncharacterized protein LOC129361350 isoform X2 n=1 Tax=Poeciliopsis prolifica TaxID=188132 RepID=UPI002413354C|nr:uncharacterized protein LOC129361350 isoform X2 [Poeciliopsis prolifica]